MTFTEAAREVLKQCGHPLHYKEITEIAIEKNLLSHVGKSPEVTMGARLAATLKKGGDDTPLIRVKPGVFALRDWDEETIKKGLEIKRSSPKKKKKDEDAKDKDESKGKGKPKDDKDEKKDDSKKGSRRRTTKKDAEEEASGEDVEEEQDEASDDDSDKETSDPKTSVVKVASGPQSPDEAKRAEIAASASEIFAEEDDDDQPILKSNDDEAAESNEGGRGRRRRRRRRRGSRKSEPGGNGESGQLPAYTAKPVESDEGVPRGPQVIELSSKDMPALDDVSGRDLSDAVVMVLSSFDRTVGAVSLRQIAETAQRHNKLSGDLQLAQSHIAAAVRADNSRRQRLGQRPRFRLAGGRVGLTDWMLDKDLARCERDVIQALGRYREAAKKAVSRKCSELPGHAFVELVLMLLERVGAQGIHPVKFPGASGAEAHFAATLHAPAGMSPGRVGNGTGMPLAVVVRKDGRDIGRERVTELRGSAHHYDGAKMGWIFTAGQLLSGAKEECASEQVMPVTLLDGLAMAELCSEYGVAVIRSEHPVAIPDVDLFEALRSS